MQLALNSICAPSGDRGVPDMVHVLGTPQKMSRNASFVYFADPKLPSTRDFVPTAAAVFTGPGYSVEDTCQTLGRLTGGDN